MAVAVRHPGLNFELLMPAIVAQGRSDLLAAEVVEVVFIVRGLYPQQPYRIYAKLQAQGTTAEKHIIPMYVSVF